MSYPRHLNRVSGAWYPLPSGGPNDVAAYIDGLFQDEIRGWVIDVDNPQRIVTVCVRINGTLAGKVAACHHRSDLCSLFLSSGLHGFAFRVPERFFAQSKWHVEVLLEDGRYLCPRALEIESPSDLSGPIIPLRSPCLLFLHIPKTAGTSLRSALSQGSHVARRLFLYPHPPGFPGEYILYLAESQLANLECVYGHFGVRIHQFMPQLCEYATLVREPVARTLSHFQQLRKSAVSGTDLAAASPDDFFAAEPGIDFDNLMTRLISGETGDILPIGGVNESVFRHAIDNLHNRFAYVGLQERADESAEQLLRRMGLPPTPLERKNPSDPGLIAASSPATLAAIRLMNEYDIRLYDYVREHFWDSGREGWVR